MEEDEKNYYVFVWTVDEEVVQFGYGKDSSHLAYKPDGYPDAKLKALFPYTDLTEKEAFVLFRYEKNKFKKFRFTTTDRLGFSDEIMF